MYQEDDQFSVFQDLCWDAIQTLRDNEASICDAWTGAFLGMSLTDKTLAETESLRAHLRISRAALDIGLNCPWSQTRTDMKNFAMKLKM